MLVPDAMFIRYMPARFMCMCIMSWAAAVEANSSRVFHAWEITILTSS